MKLKIIIFTIFSAFLFQSCGEDLASINTDPNSSPTANPKEALTSGLGFIGADIEALFNETSALFGQYWAGGPGVALLDHERYFIEPGDFNAEWALAYNQALSDLDFVIRNGNDARKGVAMLMTAYTYGTLVDLYGDIPYSEALKGDGLDGTAILTPKFDDDAVIYKDLIVKVDQAITLLNSTGELGAEDLVYSGDKSKWIKFGNSLKLKLLIKLGSSGENVGEAVKKLVQNGNFIEIASDMATLPFSGGANNFNPQYSRRESGVGQFYVASNSYVNLLKELNDPRLGKLFKPAGDGTIKGLDQGGIQELVAPAKTDFSFPSSVAYSKTNPAIFMSNWEVFFLRSEAAVKYTTVDDAQLMFNYGILANFEHVGAEDALGYIAQNANFGNLTSTDSKLNLIGIQKWIAMCGLQETEGWNESRRFDRPGNNIFTSTTTGIFSTPPRSILGPGVFPTIRLYPQSEVSFNAANTPVRTITDKVFWDN